jgi:hypothetical protein
MDRLAAEFAGAALDHAPGVDPVHHRRGERPGAADCRAEEGTLVVAGDAGSADVFVEGGFELVVRRHLVALAAFLVVSERRDIYMSALLWRFRSSRSPRFVEAHTQPRARLPNLRRLRFHVVQEMAGHFRAARLHFNFMLTNGV